MPGSGSSPSSEYATCMAIGPIFGLVYQAELFMIGWCPVTVPAMKASADVPLL